MKVTFYLKLEANLDCRFILFHAYPQAALTGSTCVLCSMECFCVVFALFYIEFFICKNALYIFETNFLLAVYISNIFFKFVVCICILLETLDKQKFLVLI